MRKPRLVSFNLEDEEEKRLFEFTYSFNFSKGVKRWLYAQMEKENGNKHSFDLQIDHFQVTDEDNEDVSSYL